MPANYVPEEVLMPPSPLDFQVLFVGGVDLVETTETYGNPAGQQFAKEWHDFIGFTPDTTGASLGWVSVNHEMIYRDDRIGDGGGMTVFRVQRAEDGTLEVMDQTLSDGRSGKYFNVDFANTVGETGMNCGGITSTVDGRIWTAEEWFRGDNTDINNSSADFRIGEDLPLRPGRSANTNQGVRDTMDYTISSDIPGFDGLTWKAFENFNWMVEIDPREAVAIRKQYNWGRGGWEGGAIATDNRTVYLGWDGTPGFWTRFIADTPGDFRTGITQVYKHDATGDKWITIDNQDPQKMLEFGDASVAVAATMYNRIEWVNIDPVSGLVYMTETGRDAPGSRWEGEFNDGAVLAPHHIARATAQSTTPTAGDYNDFYGRVLVYDPATEEVSVLIEGGPDFDEVGPDIANYPAKHLSNPDGLNVMTIDDQQFLIICEDLNGRDYGRMPSDAQDNSTCELYLLNLSIENPTVDDLIRISAVPAGAEVTGAQVTSDGQTLLVNSQHPRSTNSFPYNHSLTFAIHGFGDLTVTDLQEPEIQLEEKFKAYPNPALQTVYLNQTTDVAIYNQAGQRLNVYRNVNQITVNHLPTGIYFLRNAEGEFTKLIVE